jgi:acetyltransferase (GNAT) family protein
MADDIKFEWIDGPNSQGPRPATIAEWDAIDELCAARGWMSLNRQLTRILVAKRGEEIAGFIVLQLVPHTEPLYVAPSERGTDLAASLADQMVEFLLSVKARGWMVVADNPHAKKLCEDRGMTKVKSPVFIAK